MNTPSNYPPFRDLKALLADLELDCNMQQLGSIFSSRQTHLVPRRSYKYERVQQMMRYVATLLFCYLKKKGFSPVEVQCMTVDDNCFMIGCNDTRSSKYLAEAIKPATIGSLLAPVTYKRMKLFLKEFCAHCARELYKYTDAYSAYWINKSWMDLEDVLSKQLAVGHYKTLTTSTPELLDAIDVNGIVQAVNRGGLYVVYKSTDVGARKGRHIEKKYMDICSIMNQRCDFSHGAKDIIVGGRMRPCVTCFTRLNTERENLNNLVITHGQRPGNFWTGKLRLQSRQVRNNTPRFVREIYRTQLDDGGQTREVGTLSNSSSFDSCSPYSSDEEFFCDPELGVVHENNNNNNNSSEEIQPSEEEVQTDVEDMIDALLGDKFTISFAGED